MDKIKDGMIFELIDELNEEAKPEEDDGFFDDEKKLFNNDIFMSEKEN